MTMKTVMGTVPMETEMRSLSTYTEVSATLGRRGQLGQFQVHRALLLPAQSMSGWKQLKKPPCCPLAPSHLCPMTPQLLTGLTLTGWTRNCMQSLRGTQ